SDFLLRFLVCGVATDGLDLARPVADVLIAMQLIGLGSARREAVIARQLAIHLGSDSVWSAMLALGKAEQRQPLQRRTSLATSDDHFDGRHGSWRRLGAVRLFA